jgi:hypothetical protein
VNCLYAECRFPLDNGQLFDRLAEIFDQFGWWLRIYGIKRRLSRSQRLFVLYKAVFEKLGVLLNGIQVRDAVLNLVGDLGISDFLPQAADQIMNWDHPNSNVTAGAEVQLDVDQVEHSALYFGRAQAFLLTHGLEQVGHLGSSVVLVVVLFESVYCEEERHAA